MKKNLIFICSYNSKNYTKKLFDELSFCLEYIDIIIIDNSNIKEEICDFGNCIHIGYENVEFGGMHDYILKMPIIENYEFIGIFNNDIFGFTSEHFKILQNYLNENTGYISFSISPDVDKAVTYAHGGIMKTRENSIFRFSNFIENIAPIYNIKLIKELKKFSPIHKFGLIDYFMSRKSIDMGLNNIIIDNFYIHHVRSGVRKLTGSLQNYYDNGSIETENWKRRFPEIIKYIN